MSEAKHSPLPWNYELTDSMEDDEDAFVIMSPDGDVAEVTSPADSAEANAALIVRAVNAHDALVAACEKAFAVFDGIHTVAPHGAWYADECKLAVDQLRAALALART